MLQSLSIRNIVLVESLDIELASGLCVLSGETGAGKSIILDSLGLVLGARKGTKLLRHGAEQGSVTAEFDITQLPHIKTLLKEQEIDSSDNVLLLRRTLNQSGKSRAFINDTPVSQDILANIGEMLVEIHGQHDQRGLLNPAVHREVLDGYGELEKEVTAVKQAYAIYRTLQKKLTDLEEKRTQALREEDYLRHIYKELSTLAPAVGEEEELAHKRHALMNRDKVLSVLQEALANLSSGQDIPGQLYNVQRTLSRATDLETTSIIENLERASIEISDAISQLEGMMDKLTNKEANLEHVEERLFGLRAASRKFHRSADELPAYLEEVSAKLSLLENQETISTNLAHELKEAKEQYQQLAASLSEKRKATASNLEKILVQELAPLKMEATRFIVKFTELPETEWSENGIDAIQFIVSMNPGMPPAPLSQVASGGELSRFMLALKVVLAGVKSVPTMIFDEIDTGIGGAVAAAVGKRLSLLGKARQVLVVTHQPQVAAYGTYHLKVAKSQQHGQTFTHLSVLDNTARKEELARMLAGSEVTDEARAAADRLLLQDA